MDDGEGVRLDFDDDDGGRVAVAVAVAVVVLVHGGPQFPVGGEGGAPYGEGGVLLGGRSRARDHGEGWDPRGGKPGNLMVR